MTHYIVFKDCFLFFCAGTNLQGVVEITNCFCVPHNESEDEVMNIYNYQ